MNTIFLILIIFGCTLQQVCKKAYNIRGGTGTYSFTAGSALIASVFFCCYIRRRFWLFGSGIKIFSCICTLLWCVFSHIYDGDIHRASCTYFTHNTVFTDYSYYLWTCGFRRVCQPYAYFGHITAYDISYFYKYRV